MARIADFIYQLTIILCVSVQLRDHGDEEKTREIQVCGITWASRIAGLKKIDK